jgi:hypothetical protein
MVHMASIVISVVSLLVSVTTAWLTLFRRGTVKMTQPTVIFFGPDTPVPASTVHCRKSSSGRSCSRRRSAAGLLNACTSRFSRNETHQNFNIWVYGNDKLVRGSGLFVGETGVEANHHFLAPRDASSFCFAEGHYRLEVFARLLGDQKQTRLFSQALDISREIAASLAEPNAGVYFDWGPDSSRYLPHVENRPPSPDPVDFFKALGSLRTEK